MNIARMSMDVSKATSTVRVLVACVALSFTGTAAWAKPLSKDDFADRASRRDRDMGDVLVETDKAVIFSKSISKDSNTCGAGTVMVPAADALARYEKEKAAFDAALAEFVKKRGAWQAAYDQVGPEYNEHLRELNVEVRAMRARLRPKTAADDQRIFDYQGERFKALRERYIVPLGEAPQHNLEEPKPPTGTEVSGYSVLLTVLVLNKGFYEPLFASDAEAQALQQSYLSVLERMCPTVNTVEVNYGFYDILTDTDSKGAPPIPLQQTLTKKGTNWQVTSEYTPLKKLELNMVSRATLLMANQSKEGRVLKGVFLSGKQLLWYWLSRDGDDLDFAFEHVFEHKAPNAPKLPGLVHKNRQYWSQFSASGGAYDRDSELLQYAKVVLAGRFDVLPNGSHADSAIAVMREYGRLCRPNRFDTEWFEVRVTETTKHRNLHAEWETSDTYGAGQFPQRFADIYQTYNLEPPNVNFTRDAVEKDREFVRRFFEKESCESPVTQQLLNNFARLVRKQPSLQGIAARK